MITKCLVLVVLVNYLIGFVSCLTVDISIEPKYITIGDDLSVTCTIFGNTIDKGFKTLLNCPFHEKDGFCITNCDSMDICSSNSCNRKMVAGQKFQCELIESPTSLIYTYTFQSISDSVVKNQKRLPFKCSFRGIEATGFANILFNKPFENPVEKTETAISTQKTSVNHNQNINYKNILESDNFLRLSDLILIALISCLIISFLINVWCCVQWCIRNSRIRATKRKVKLRQKSTEYNLQENNNNEITSQYYSQDYIKRAKSHPTLSNNERNFPNRFASCNVNQSNVALLNNRSKYRNSVHNSTAMEEEDMNNGSNHSLLNSLYGQMVLAPIQCFNPSIVPYLSPLPNSYSQQIPINSDHCQSQQNLEIFTNEEIPEKQDTSLFHPLPKKPE